MSPSKNQDSPTIYFDSTGSKGLKFGKEPVFFDNTGSKGHKFGYAPGEGKLLVTLEDITMNRGFEIMQEVYFVILGFNPYGTEQNQDLVENADPLLDQLIPQGADARNFFYGAVTPIIKMKRKRKHIFPGGLPLYYGFPGKMTSFYLAVMESDKGARQFGKALAKKETKDAMGNAFKQLGKIGTMAQSAKFIAVQAGFSAMTQVLQTLLLNNKDDFRYSNVFTFRQSEDYMAGVHNDWGNHRVGMTLEVTAPEREWIFQPGDQAAAIQTS